MRGRMGLKSRSLWMFGSATFTMLMSRHHHQLGDEDHGQDHPRMAEPRMSASLRRAGGFDGRGSVARHRGWLLRVR